MEKPILFNTDMVRAILDGRKTVTRRLVKPQPIDTIYQMIDVGTGHKYKQPYQPGNILYVRETWCDPSGTGWPIMYKADMPIHYDAKDTETGICDIDIAVDEFKWRPSIHMPKDAARIFLQVKDVQAERLQDITEKGAISEGIRIGLGGTPYFSCRDAFSTLWDSTVKLSDIDIYSWDSNPWVWVIEFERIDK